MKYYVNEIIDLLADDSVSLVKPFTQAQIFAKRVGNDDLYNWVLLQLNGYENGENLPQYRFVRCVHNAVLRQGYQLTDPQPFPWISVSEEVRNMFIKYRVPNSITSLESIIEAADQKTMLRQEFDRGLCQMLSNDIKKQGLSFSVHSVVIEVAPFELSQVLANIRSKLLELMLELENQYPDLEEKLQSKQIDKQEVIQSITIIMNKYNIKTTGDGNNVNMGDKVTQTNNAVINKGDKEALKKFLNENGVSDEDYYQLAEVIDEEANVATTTSYGAKVGAWIQKMVGKAVEGSWQVGIGAAGSILAEGIGKYYGLF